MANMQLGGTIIVTENKNKWNLKYTCTCRGIDGEREEKEEWEGGRVGEGRGREGEREGGREIRRRKKEGGS